MVRTRIQWWQEQEKIRQDMETQRLAAENLKNEQEEQKAEQIISNQTDDEDLPDEVQEKLQQEVAANFTLLNIMGSTIFGTVTQNQINGQGSDATKLRIRFTTIRTPYNNVIPVSAVVLTKDNKDTSLTFEDK